MQASNSSETTKAFALLEAPIQKWVWKQGWSSLRDIQVEAIPHLLSAGDAIISAATAGGKTEAAFLPLLSRVVTNGRSNSFDILYISPLKALINDQYRRLEEICEDLKLPLTKWHGDVSAGIKQKALKNPGGVLLITPESLESLLMRKGLHISRFFGATQAIVIDELHAFMGTERGVQLRSLMNRLEVLVGRQIDRIGLSATLGDLSLAADYLRSNSPIAIPIICGKSGETEFKLQLRCYVDGLQKGLDNSQTPASQRIAEHIFKAIRGEDNLVFAGSKQNVELYGATLRDICEKEKRPNEFFTHHANISKSDREALERRLKQSRLPTTAVCTSTLELGIDIGDVKTVVQIGCSGSVAALRQRIGRSGRRPGAPTILRAYNRSVELSDKADILDMIQPRLIQAIAEIELLMEGKYEPPAPRRLHFSTLVHQVLALIMERGGATAITLFEVLSRASPFGDISSNLFMDILRAMARPGIDLIEQAPDGTILLGKEGEKLTSHYSFYAVFETQEEFRVICKGKDLGTLPILGPTAKGMGIIFSGRRWLIVDVYLDDKTIEVTPAKGGTPPKFGGNGPSRHRIVDKKMREIYGPYSEVQYLDAKAREVLLRGRHHFINWGLQENSILVQGDGVLIFPWAGSTMIDGLMMLFLHMGFEPVNEDYALSMKGISLERTRSIIEQLATGDIPDNEEMAWSILNKSVGLYDHYLTETLLTQQLASTMPTPEEFSAWAKSMVC